jgi:thioesterase domain-containing protein
VIYKSSITYEQPITGTFSALSALSDPTAWARFIKTLGRKHRARIRVSSVLDCHDSKVGEMEGQFVALALPGKTE